MKENKDTAKLAFRIRQHDLQSFRELYLHYMPVLQAFAFRYTYNSEVAKDLVQDAFASLWHHPEKIDGQQNLSHLLYAMVRNNCLNYLRQLRIRDRHDEKIAEALVFSTSATAIEEMDDIQQLLIQKLHRTLSLLPSKSHTILLLHIVDGLKIKEIADQYGIAESSVKTHIKRAMKLLREHLLFFLIGL